MDCFNNFFSDKPVALITASGIGEKTHESLLLLMKTIGSSFDEKTTLLIQGARAKMDNNGKIKDLKTLEELKNLVNAFMKNITLQQKN